MNLISIRVVINLDFNNIEEVIFLDKSLKDKLPEFRNLFNQWNLGRTTPGLHPLAQRTMHELLNLLSPEHIEIIEKHTGMKVNLDKTPKLNFMNFSCNINDLEEELNKINGNFAISRSDELIYVCSYN